MLDKGSSSCFAIGCIYYLMHWTRCGALYTCTYRARMRKEYNLAGDNCTDCFTSCFCEYCVICQQYRELKNRGFDLSAGWEENMRRKQGVAMAPTVEGGMKR
ncbi:PLANT CADMIUM RESISTANCE 2 [Melia azedarach]|uniref:PLANT CADMIUM RESISTANCE 2 n=1 Tax=Melia azedarach TaxID=155640 RepID=A0ACC1XF59_MELAZ|nr:PLANT CADMIUM RESISTANCE 2 [Melia azedarach]